MEKDFDTWNLLKKRFERPVLVIKVFNRKAIRVIPMTSKVKNDDNHVAVGYLTFNSYAILSQTKTISTKRLSRKIGRIGLDSFGLIIDKLHRFLA